MLMKRFYETLSIKFQQIDWNGTLDAAVAEASAIKPPLVRVVYTDGQEDFTVFREDMISAEKRLKVTRVELLMRDPLAAMKKKNWDPHDRHDQNVISWAGGQRGISSPPRGDSMRGTPMFFRENGKEIDLLGLYHGQTCFLVLNGPSLNQIDKAKLKLPGVTTFGVNNGGHEIRPNMWTCVDDPTRFMPSIWRDPNIMKFVPMAHFPKPIWDVARNCEGPPVQDHPNVIGFRRNERFRAQQYLTEQSINWGNHSDLGGGRSCMMSALRIIQLLGFKKLFLLGCDFNMSPSAKYFFPEERTKGAINNNNNSYAILMERMAMLQPFLLKDGLHIYNCNPDSALKVFPHVNFDEAIASSVIDTSAHTLGMYTEKPKRNP